VPTRSHLAGTVLILFGLSCAARADTVNVGAAQSGASIDIRVRDTLVVRRDSNPSTGFDWDVVGSTAPVLDLSERTFELTVRVRPS